jgi:hypothetical protein
MAWWSQGITVSAGTTSGYDEFIIVDFTTIGLILDGVVDVLIPTQINGREIAVLLTY